MLTLPGPWWTFERAILRTAKGKSKISFISFERESALFELACIKMPRRGKRGLQTRRFSEETNGRVVTNKRNVCLVQGDVLKYILIGKDKRGFDAAWLDFCAPLSRRILRAVRAIKCRELLALTFMIGREEFGMASVFRESGGRKESLLRRLPGFKLADYLEYRDGCLMAQMILEKKS